MLREQNARDLAFRQQREQGLEAARQAVLADQQRRLQDEQERRRADEANAKAAYERLLDQAEQAKAKGQPEIAISALQTARQLRPSPEIDRLVAAGLVDQAKAAADKQGKDERQKLEAQLAAEQERRQQAELQAAQNKAKYDETLRQANAALTARNFAVAKQHFQLAAQTLHTDEAVIGLRQADDELAKSQAAADAARKSQEEQQRKDAEVARLLAEAKAATAAKQFDKAQQSLQAAIALKPAAVEAQVELIKTQHAKDDHVALLRQSPEIPTIQPVPMVDPPVGPNQAFAQAVDRARTAIKANQFDTAVQAIAEAGRIDPSSAELKKVRQELADARTAMQNAADLAKRQAALKAETERLKNYDDAMSRGKAFATAKQYVQASDAFALALKFAPNDPAATQALNDTRTAMIPPKKETPKVDPVKAAHDQYLTAARAAFAARQFEDAIRQATEALKLIPNDAEAAKIIADSRLALTPPKKETPKVDPTPPPKKDPPLPKVDPVKAAHDQYLTAARAAFGARQFEEAIRQATEALRLIPSDAEAAKIIADSRLALTPPKKETPKVDPAPPPKKDPPKVNPVQAQLNQVLQNAAALENQNRYTDALKDYQEALKLAPANAELKKKIEFCKGMDGAIKDLAAGRFGEATIGFDLSLKLYPTDANAKRYLEMAKGKKK